MQSERQIKILKKGVSYWNSWRKENPSVSPSLRDVSFMDTFPNKNEIYNLPNIEGCDFSDTDFNSASLRNGYYINCNFNGASINFADLVDAYFESCTFNEVTMRVTKIGSASFNNCSFIDSDLSYCSAQDTSFSGSSFVNTKLEHISFINNDFSNSKIEDCFVYGISSWDLKLQDATQKNLIITNDEQPIITVDNIELAQFLYLIINNKKLRDVIDAITSKVVLILGNFSPERKSILNEIREILRRSDYIPVMFDFDKPISRNLTETVMTLANMSKFVIADLSGPRSIPHELASIIPRLQSVNFYPIIQEGEIEYSMFEDLLHLPWVKPIKQYNEIESLVSSVIQEES